MYKITNECIEKELTVMLEKGSLTPGNVRWINDLSLLMQNIKKMHHEFTEEDAKEWAKHMNPPARWTMEQTTAVMHQNGYSHKPCEFWVVMNMLFSDYGKTMIKFSADKPEIWAALAHDFLDDPDTKPDKVGRYWRDVVKH